MHGQASRQAHLNQMWRASECEPKSFSDPNNEPPAWLSMTSYTAGVSPLTRDWYFIISTSIWRLFVHFSSSAAFGGLDRPSFAFVQRWPPRGFLAQPACFSLLTALTTAPPHFIHKTCGDTSMHNSGESEKKQLMWITGMEVQWMWVRAGAYLCIYTRRLCTQLALTDVFIFVNMRGCALLTQGGLGENILQMQISEDLLDVFLLRYRLTRLCQTLGAIKSTL